METVETSPWLSDRQQRLWRDWLAMHAELSAVLQRQLQDGHGLSLADFAVLVQLTDAPDERVRVIALAKALSWERSRLSHHVTRMQSRGLVERRECCEDGRGAFVVITAEGRAAIERAAPDHARTVRELMFDPLTEDDLSVISRVTSETLHTLRSLPPQ